MGETFELLDFMKDLVDDRPSDGEIARAQQHLDEGLVTAWGVDCRWTGRVDDMLGERVTIHDEYDAVVAKLRVPAREMSPAVARAIASAMSAGMRYGRAEIQTRIRADLGL